MKLNNFFNDKLTRQAAGDPPSGAEGTPPAGPDLSFIPADYHTDGQPDLGKFTAHYQDVVARDAQYAERLAQVPEAYEFATTPDLKFDGLDLPEGFKAELDRENPILAPLFEDLGGFLKEVGAPASSATKISDMIARYEAVKYSQQYAAQKAEMAALGTPAQAQARLASIDRVLASRLPADQAEALKQFTSSAAAVKALEALLRPEGHQSAPRQPGGSDPNLSPLERLKAANSRQ